MFDDQLTAKDPDRLLATIAELDRREKELAALQLELLGELVRRYFAEISMAVQGTALPACSSRTSAAPST
jgi:hypothetical protein